MTETLTAAVPPVPDAVAGTVERLRATFDSGRTRSYEWRMAQLRGLVTILDDHEDELVDALVQDLRRVPFEAILLDLVTTRAEAIHAIKHLHRWMRPRRVSPGLAGRPGRAWYQHEPLGVTLVIAPWNYPIQLALAPLVGAFAAGNCAVVKPSEITPTCSRVLAELLPAHLDPDAVAVVEGGPAETTALIDQRPDHVFFTGSPGVGAKIMAAAAPHLVPVTLELGGKCPTVVTASANVEVAARRIAFGKLLNSGQTCVAPDHVLVERAVRDQLVDELASSLTTFAEGRRLPLVSSRHAARIADLLDSAGGELALGGTVDVDGAWAEPTIVVDPDPTAPIMSEEIFGPVLPVITVDSIDEAIAHVRAGTRPLAAYLFSEDRRDEQRMLAEVTSGATVVNQVVVHLTVPDLPFGGVGTSGMGVYHGHWGFETFSHPRAVVRRPSRPDLRFVYPPHSDWAKALMRRLL